MKCQVPLRIDLAGGWSDIPVFARREGGAVVNAAIAIYVTGELTSGPEGIHVTYGMELPSGNGLGSSAALTVAWLSLIYAQLGRAVTAADLAADACRVADLVGVLGGKQDEYAAASGGVNLMRFGESVSVEPLLLDRPAREVLESHLMLCFSGVSRLSAEVHDAVWAAYERGDHRVAETLRGLRDVALAMLAPLTAGDMHAVASLVARNWELQKSLHDSVTNSVVEGIIDAGMAAGAWAAKACGAGGGGCVVLIVPPAHRTIVSGAVVAAGASLLDARIDVRGVVVER